MERNNVPLYLREPFPHAPIFAVVAVVGFIASIVFILKGCILFPNSHQTVSQVLVALWVLGPPLWFFYEYFYYFPSYGNMAEGAGFEKLKAAQDVTAKLWVAFSIVIAALYNKSFPT